MTLATSGCPASILATSPDFYPDWLWCPLQLTILSLPCTHRSCLNEPSSPPRKYFRRFLVTSLPQLFPLLSRQMWESHFWNLAPTASRRLPEGLVPSRLFPPPLSPSHLLPHACSSFGFGLGLDWMGWCSPAAHLHEGHLFTGLFAWLAREVSEFMCGYQSHDACPLEFPSILCSVSLVFKAILITTPQSLTCLDSAWLPSVQRRCPLLLVSTEPSAQRCSPQAAAGTPQKQVSYRETCRVVIQIIELHDNMTIL